MACELCDLTQERKIKTKVYRWADDFVIVECLTCNVPMGVIRRHGEIPPNSEPYNKMMWALKEVGDELYGENNWHYRTQMRKIPDHIHVHIEPK